MDKITRLTRELKELEKQKREAQALIEWANQRQDETYGTIAQSYFDFFDTKRNSEFVLYEQYPSISALELYLSRISRNFSLAEYGKLNAKELVEVIKQIYQLKTGKEFDIVTIGTTEINGSPVYGGQVFSMKPHLSFLIGNEQTLAPYQEYDGKFLNDDHLYYQLYFGSRRPNLVTIELEEEATNSFGIECLTGQPYDRRGEMNCFDETSHTGCSFGFDLYKQVFSSNIRSKLNLSKVRGIKAVFDLSIHSHDTYLAKILLSMVLYKRNKHLQTFTSEDYDHIFDVLFGEKVSIIEEAEKDIPKQLLYIPNQKYRR